MKMVMDGLWKRKSMQIWQLSNGLQKSCSFTSSIKLLDDTGHGIKYNFSSFLILFFFQFLILLLKAWRVLSPVKIQP